MRLAIDTSVLLAILDAEPSGTAWLDLLVEARRAGRLVVCDVVYAELAAAFSDRGELDSTLGKLGIGFDPIGTEAAWRAGTLFKVYRQEGGPRQHLIPDFLIAAHARVQADRLAAADRGYMRRYFSDLSLARID